MYINTAHVLETCISSVHVFSMIMLIIVLLLKLRNIIGLQHNRGRGAGKLS